MREKPGGQEGCEKDGNTLNDLTLERVRSKDSVDHVNGGQINRSVIPRT
jgi:hypothetical protein